MRLGRFVWRNAFRNKRRTGLTILSIGFSLFLLLSLLTFMDQLLHPVMQAESALRLIVSPATSLADMMPMAYMDKIKQTPHVKRVSTLQWFNGVYKDPSFLFPNFGVDAKEVFEIYGEQKIDTAQRASFIADRTAAAASESLAKRFGWKVGDRITLTGTIFAVDLDLLLAGFFSDPLNQDMLYFHHEYLDESLGGAGVCGAFAVQGDNTASIAGIADAIDAQFRNSPNETKTQTEKAFVLGFVSMLGDIQFIILSVASVVVFTMVLVSVGTMAMTVRERVREVAILKTIGYPARTLLGLVVAESVFISMSGAAMGIALGLSLKFVDLAKVTQGFIINFSPAASTYAIVLGVGLGIGLVSGYFPARQAVRLGITTAMRRLD